MQYDNLKVNKKLASNFRSPLKIYLHYFILFIYLLHDSLSKTYRDQLCYN